MEQYKVFETVVHILQSSFKDSKNTKIFQNYKIPNTSGNNREIDILVQSKINDFDIQIAIECKNYKRKIEVEKIEAFHSKCLRIPTLNKKVFIAKNGFQKDAIGAAKDFGIELYLLNDINDSEIKKWLYADLPRPVNVQRTLNGLGIEFSEPVPQYNENNLLYFSIDGAEGVPILDYLKNIVNKEVRSPLFIFRKKDEELHEKKYKITINCKDTYLEINTIRYEVKKIWTFLVESYSPLENQVSLNSLHKLTEENYKAQSATFITNKGEIFSFVKKTGTDEIEIYLRDKDDPTNTNEIDVNFLASLKVEKL